MRPFASYLGAPQAPTLSAAPRRRTFGSSFFSPPASPTFKYKEQEEKRSTGETILRIIPIVGGAIDTWDMIQDDIWQTFKDHPVLTSFRLAANALDFLPVLGLPMAIKAGVKLGMKAGAKEVLRHAVLGTSPSIFKGTYVGKFARGRAIVHRRQVMERALNQKHIDRIMSKGAKTAMLDPRRLIPRTLYRKVYRGEEAADPLLEQARKEGYDPTPKQLEATRTLGYEEPLSETGDVSIWRKLWRDTEETEELGRYAWFETVDGRGGVAIVAKVDSSLTEAYGNVQAYTGTIVVGAERLELGMLKSLDDVQTMIAALPYNRAVAEHAAKMTARWKKGLPSVYVGKEGEALLDQARKSLDAVEDPLAFGFAADTVKKYTTGPTIQEKLSVHNIRRLIQSIEKAEPYGTRIARQHLGDYQVELREFRRRLTDPEFMKKNGVSIFKGWLKATTTGVRVNNGALDREIKSLMLAREEVAESIYKLNNAMDLGEGPGRATSGSLLTGLNTLEGTLFDEMVLNTLDGQALRKRIDDILEELHGRRETVARLEGQQGPGRIRIDDLMDTMEMPGLGGPAREGRPISFLKGGRREQFFDAVEDLTQAGSRTGGAGARRVPSGMGPLSGSTLPFRGGVKVGRKAEGAVSEQAMDIANEITNMYWRMGLELKASVPGLEELVLRKSYVTHLLKDGGKLLAAGAEEGPLKKFIRLLERNKQAADFQNSGGRRFWFRFMERGNRKLTIDAMNESAWETFDAYFGAAIRVKHTQRAMIRINEMLVPIREIFNTASPRAGMRPVQTAIDMEAMRAMHGDPHQMRRVIDHYLETGEGVAEGKVILRAGDEEILGVAPMAEEAAADLLLTKAELKAFKKRKGALEEINYVLSGYGGDHEFIDEKVLQGLLYELWTSGAMAKVLKFPAKWAGQEPLEQVAGTGKKQLAEQITGKQMVHIRAAQQLSRHLYQGLLFGRMPTALAQFTQFVNTLTDIGGVSTIRGIGLLAQKSMTSKGFEAGARSAVSGVGVGGALAGAAVGGLALGPVGAAVGAAITPVSRFVSGAVKTALPESIKFRIGQTTSSRLLRGPEYLRATNTVMAYLEEVGFSPLDMAETILRGASFLGGLDSAARMGYTTEKALDYGLDIVDGTQFLYDQLSRHPWFRHSAIGIITAPLTSYPLKQAGFLKRIITEGAADGAPPVTAMTRYLFWNGLLATVLREGAKELTGEPLSPRPLHERIEPAILRGWLPYGVDAPAGFESVASTSLTRAPGPQILRAITRAMQDESSVEELVDALVKSFVPFGLVVSDLYRAGERIETGDIRQREGLATGLSLGKLLPSPFKEGRILPDVEGWRRGDRSTSVSRGAYGTKVRATTPLKEYSRLFGFVSEEEAREMDEERQARDFAANYENSEVIREYERISRDTSLTARGKMEEIRELAISTEGQRKRALGGITVSDLSNLDFSRLKRAYKDLNVPFRNLVQAGLLGGDPNAKKRAIKLGMDAFEYDFWVRILNRLVKEEEEENTLRFRRY